jgi:hypothetical protein
MSKLISKAIGGYFELELPHQKQHLYPEAIHLQSARATLYALLIAGKPNRVWMPKYICDSMLAPLKATEIETVFYGLESDFSVSNDVKLESDDWLLYVNYFGVCSYQENNLLKRFNPFQLILDHSQAFFVPPRECLATIYSPRKFFGVPDGGLLVTSLFIEEPEEIDTGSVERCKHLLIRLDSKPEAGYQHFKDADDSLQKIIQPLRMSKLTDRLLGSVDYIGVKRKRNSNFLTLHRLLKGFNNLMLHESQIDGPLCYPLLLDDSTVRERLLANRVFVATYWPDVRGKVNVDDFEQRLVDYCLPIPCDQRYDTNDMERIVRIIKQD